MSDAKEEEKRVCFEFYPGTITLKDDKYVLHINKMDSDEKFFGGRMPSFPYTPAGYAEAAAKHKEISDEYGFTKKYSFPVPTQSKQQYLAGFFDGDGCIQMTTCGTLELQVAQSSSNDDQPAILLEFQKYFGGEVYMNAKRTVNQRPQFQYKVTARLALPLVEIVSKYGIIKRPQAELVLKHIPEEGVRGFRMTLKDSESLDSNLRKLKGEYASIQIDESRMTIPWTAGLADAEGCAFWDERARLQLTQKGCPRIIAILKKKMGGYLNGFSVRTCGKNAIHWMLKLRPYLIVKRDQVDLIIDHHRTISRFPKRRCLKEKKYLESILKDHLHVLKHGLFYEPDSGKPILMQVTDRKLKRTVSDKENDKTTKRRKIDKD